MASFCRGLFIWIISRTGAIARFHRSCPPSKFAKSGGLVMGVCNGFQILLEAGLLPGAMLRNRSLHFVCKDVHVRVENAATPFTGACKPGQVLKIPIAHAEEYYYTDPVMLAGLQANAQIVFGIAGRASDGGSQSRRLARQYCRHSQCRGNVLGMMPHPERSAEELMKRGRTVDLHIDAGVLNRR